MYRGIRELKWGKLLMRLRHCDRIWIMSPKIFNHWSTNMVQTNNQRRYRLMPYCIWVAFNFHLTNFYTRKQPNQWLVSCNTTNYLSQWNSLIGRLWRAKKVKRLGNLQFTMKLVISLRFNFNFVKDNTMGGTRSTIDTITWKWLIIDLV